MRLLCFRHSKVSAHLFLEKMYKIPHILQLVLHAKHQKRKIKIIEKLAANYLLQLKNQIEQNL